MRIITKRLKVIQMSAEEIQKFHDLMQQAEQGHTSHYAEDRLSDGSFLGVQVVSKAEQDEQVQREREERWTRHSMQPRPKTY